MLSDSLTANSIFVAIIGLLVFRELLSLPLTVLIRIVLLSVLGFSYVFQWRSSSVVCQGRTSCGDGRCLTYDYRTDSVESR